MIKIPPMWIVIDSDVPAGVYQWTDEVYSLMADYPEVFEHRKRIRTRPYNDPAWFKYSETYPFFTL